MILNRLYFISLKIEASFVTALVNILISVLLSENGGLYMYVSRMGKPGEIFYEEVKTPEADG